MTSVGFNGTSSNNFKPIIKKSLGLGEVEVEFKTDSLPVLYPDPGRYLEIGTGKFVRVFHPQGIEEYMDEAVFFFRVGDVKIYYVTLEEFRTQFKLAV